MRVDWTVSGACTSGWIGPPRDAMSTASGGAATMSTATAERGSRLGGHASRTQVTHGFEASFSFRASLRSGLLWCLGAVLRAQRSGHDRLVQLDVGDGRNGNARWL